MDFQTTMRRVMQMILWSLLNGLPLIYNYCSYIFPLCYLGDSLIILYNSAVILYIADTLFFVYLISVSVAWHTKVYFSLTDNGDIIIVYSKKYAHGFVVLCFVVVMQSFIMNSHELFIHIHQGCFAGTGTIVRLPQCQWSKPDGYGKISQCITTTKHSKAKTVCIFLGIYCTNHSWYRHWFNKCRTNPVSRRTPFGKLKICRFIGTDCENW